MATTHHHTFLFLLLRDHTGATAIDIHITADGMTILTPGDTGITLITVDTTLLTGDHPIIMTDIGTDLIITTDIDTAIQATTQAMTPIWMPNMELTLPQ